MLNCDVCGHEASHLPASRFEQNVRRWLGAKPALSACATADNNIGFDDMNRCMCAAPAHALGAVAGIRWVEDL